MRASWRCLFVLVWAIVLPTVVRAQDAAFRNGIGARDDKKWDEVVTQMRAAIGTAPAEATRKVRLGFLRLESIEYLPHFFLGEALWNRGDCVGAITEWMESERQGAVRSRPDFVRSIEQGYASCLAKGVLPPSEYQPLVQRVESALADANTAAQSIVEWAQRNADAWREGQDLREQYERARAEVETARSRFATAQPGRSAAGLNDARTLAERGRDSLRRVRAELDAAIDLRTRLQGQARDAEQAIGAAEDADRSIDTLLASAPVKIALTPEMDAARQRGRDTITRARARLSAGGRGSDATGVAEAVTLAQEASTAFALIKEQVARLAATAVERERGRLLAAADEAVSFAKGALATVDRLLSQRSASIGPPLRDSRDAAERQLETGQRRLAAARKAGELQGLRQATQAVEATRRQLEGLIAAFGTEHLSLEDRGVHPALMTAARHFFAGEYADAVSVLDDARLSTPDVPLQLHVHLFRAASLFALYVRSGETAEALRARATAETESCKQLDPSFAPDPRAFGPRFIAFFVNKPLAQ